MYHRKTYQDKIEVLVVVLLKVVLQPKEGSWCEQYNDNIKLWA